MTRRELLHHAGLGLLGAAALPLAAAAAEPTKADAKAKAAKSAKTGSAAAGPVAELVPLNRFPRMMHDYFLPRIAAQERATEAKRAALRTRGEAETFIRERAAK